jgi:hypothetical protein
VSTQSSATIVEKANELAQELLPKVTEVMGSAKEQLAPQIDKAVEVAKEALQAASEALTKDPAKAEAGAVVAAEAGEAVQPGRRRWPLAVLGLALAAGAAVTAKVLAGRKNRDEQVEWPTYEPPGTDVDAAVAEAKKTVADAADVATETVTNTAKDAGETAGEVAEAAEEQVTDITDAAAESAKGSA